MNNNTYHRYICTVGDSFYNWYTRSIVQIHTRHSWSLV